MSYPTNSDFEVMPRGTMEELRILRLFANDVIEVYKSPSNPTEKWDAVRPLVLNLQETYINHIERYPV